jgi:ABC-2 type transport system ATP-binding protein
MRGSGTEPVPVLEVADIAKKYEGRRGVEGVSFTIRTGEIYGLLGPNGAGKTTTIGIAATVIGTSRGEVIISGTNVSAKPEVARRQVGLVPQSFGLYPLLSAEENLRFFGRMYGVERSRLEARVGALLELAGLTARRRDRVAIFSGGMKRRLNLACGLVHEPKLLLLDEPTVGVDPQSRERIFAAVEELATEGMAVLYTTHYMDEAERLCHRVAIMDEGRFVAEGTVHELASLAGKGDTIMVKFKRPPSHSLLEKLRERGARRANADRYSWSENRVEETVSMILQLAASENNSIRELTVHKPNLGDVFLHLTGKELRD